MQAQIHDCDFQFARIFFIDISACYSIWNSKYSHQNNQLIWYCVRVDKFRFAGEDDRGPGAADGAGGELRQNH